ncbi:hypothetical protein [Tenacibaculum caenipelagi]|uniref:Uncharacterized protein n=1 Tax=Tenacibaculum caenipelagi TaxID=1325435 RepID=A0A4R6TAP0_9FLAO|nr:hypothetical protein [Tenacibaculum caenipelagi]TDQ23966.1 hypothetical protein DFQ07_2505 [Tenacibaculum caenipelagi]
MKKSILTLGKALNKVEQQQINGGYIEATCEDLGWNSYTCNRCEWDYDSSCWLQSGYRKCCF